MRSDRSSRDLIEVPLEDAEAPEELPKLQELDAPLLRDERGLGRRQLGAMLYKNYLLKKRGTCQFCCELFTPIGLMMILVLGWLFSLRFIDKVPEHNYATDASQLVQTAFDIFGQSVYVNRPPPLGGDCPLEYHVNMSNIFNTSFLNGTVIDNPFYNLTSVTIGNQTYHLNSTFFNDSIWYPLFNTPSFDLSDFAVFPNITIGNQTINLNSTFDVVVCYPSDPFSTASTLLNYNGPFPVPYFDEYVGIHNLIQSLVGTVANPSQLYALQVATNSRLNNLIYLGKLTFSPDTPEVRKVVDYLNRSTIYFDSVFGGVYATEDAAIDAALETKDFFDRTWALINFDKINWDKGQFEYAIRMNYTSLPTTKQVANRYVLGLNPDYQLYYFSGFLTLQSVLQNYAFQHYSNNQTQETIAQFERFFSRNISLTVPTFDEFNNATFVDQAIANLVIGIEIVQSLVNGTNISLSNITDLLPYPFNQTNVSITIGNETIVLFQDQLFNFIEELNQNLSRLNLTFLNITNGNITINQTAVEELIDAAFDFLNITFPINITLPDGANGTYTILIPNSTYLVENFNYTEFLLVLEENGFPFGETFNLTINIDIPFLTYAGVNRFVGIPFPVPSFETNQFYKSVGPMIGLVMTLSLLYPVSRLIKAIVEEKETRTKETMKIMGLMNWVFVSSWFITYFLIFSFIALIISALLASTVLQRTQFGLIFVFFWFFVLTQITFSFFLSTFFSKAKLAGIMGPIILFITVMPRYAFFSSGSNDAISEKQGASLLAPTAFAFGADLLMQYEGANLGMSFSNLYDDVFSMSTILGMLVLDFFLYAFLAWFLENVLPNEYGTRKPPYFFFLPSYWCPRKKNRIGRDESQSDQEIEKNPNEEQVSKEFANRKMVEIRRLRKVFPAAGSSLAKQETVAVAGLNLDFYEGQITALLGHNGAGKTTTISILTGLLEPTEGSVKINGLDLGEDMIEIRKSLGVCPQHNVLFPTLTVSEHLYLYATLKGVPKEEMDRAVADKIKEVDLWDKRDAYSSALSGGMQRRLHVAIALIGGSKVIFLDEPTSGMDPQARRGTWEILRKSKEGRCLILTTHFMDEADLLGDRIAIMAEGQLKCVGSSLFLKARFGIGYNLTMVKADQSCDVKRVTAMVERHVPTAVPLSNAGGEIAFQLPLDSVGRFAALFKELEDTRTSIGVGGYGVAMTTLEEVFMRIASGEVIEPNVRGHVRRESQRVSLIGPSDGKSLMEPSGADHKGSQTEKKSESTSEKKDRHSTSQRGTSEGATTDTLFAPAPAPEGTEHSQSSHHTEEDYNPLKGDESDMDNKAERGEARMTGPTDKNGSSETVDLEFDEEYKKANTGERYTAWHRQLRELLRKRAICAIRDLKGRFFEVILPVIVVALVLLILKLNFNPAGPSITLDSALYSGTHNAKAKSAGIFGGTGIFPYTPSWLATEPESFYYINTSAMPMDFELVNNQTSNDLSLWLLSTYYNHHAQDRYGAYVFDDDFIVNVNSSALQLGDIGYNTIEIPNQLTLLHNSTFFHALPILSGELASARLKMILNSTGAIPQNAIPSAYIRAQNHPLPLTQTESLTIQTFLSLFAALFILIPFCYLPASFVIFVVKERTCKAKHLQLVSGVNPYIYWLANYIWDLANFIFVVFVTMIIFELYQNDQFMGTTDKATATMLLLILYGLSSLPLSYCYSFIFSNHTSAQVGIAGLHLLFGFILLIASFILDSVESTTEANQTLKNYYRLSPAFVLGEGFINIATINLYALLDPNGVKKNAYDWEIASRSMVYMVGTAVAHCILVLLIEQNAFRVLPWIWKWCRAKIISWYNNATGRPEEPEFNPETDLPLNEDEDVKRERDRICAVADPSKSDDILLIKHLRKVYPARGNRPPMTAVHNLCLGIPRGECFGFLGVNGAGKTTTLKMLTGDTEVSYGDAFINSYSVLTEPKEVRKHVGYCPQFNPLLDLMTAREQIAMYARFRGIPEGSINYVTDKLVQKLGLEKYQNKPSGSYSGGNMRKLSLALALVGEPSVVFLDEPSTGMDPVSRRFMWNVIASVAKQRSIVLTTHSMEECEALCGRIGIMVSGQLRCLGTIQHLKSRFGKGYLMELNTSERSFQRVRLFVEETFKGAELEEAPNSQRLKYRLPGSSFSLSYIFGTIEANKKQLEIDDYSVSQSTLEQIFLLMANQDRFKQDVIDAAAV